MNVLTTGIHIDMSSMLPYMDLFLKGALLTLALSLVTVLLGSLIGFLTTLLRRSRFKVLNAIAKVYVQVIRGTPILIQLMLIRYGLPEIGINIPNLFGIDAKIIACIIALAINSGAYVCEIFRSGLNSVDKGQTEAARSLGLTSKQAMKLVILPQAIKTILPALGNEYITMIKESSIISYFGVFDLTYTQTIVKSLTYRTFEPLIVIAIFYFVLTTMLTTVLGYFERRTNKDAKN